MSLFVIGVGNILKIFYGHVGILGAGINGSGKYQGEIQMVSKRYADGTEHINKQGKKVTVVCREGDKYRWRFEDGIEVVKTHGLIPCHPDDQLKAPYRVGDRVKSNFFGWAEVIEYNGTHKIRVKFDEGGEVVAQSYAIKLGQFAPSGALKVNTHDAWVEKARAIHGDKYDYTDSVFTHYRANVKVHCNSCNKDFFIRATRHIDKHQRGCQACARKAGREIIKVSIEEFIERAGKAHNWKYTYVLPSYVKISGRVTVVCPLHGEFECDAKKHAKGEEGCPQCEESLGEKQKFASLAHRDDYLYLYVVKSDVWVLHKTCGNTFKVPVHVINSITKHVCPCCTRNRQSVTFEDFKHRAQQIFGESYEYSNYTGINNKLTFTHKVCGNTYEAHAGSHISANYGKGVGCPYCATYGFSPGREAYLYILESPHGYVKVGITHQEVEGRIRQISKSTKKLGWVFSEAKSWKMPGEDARRIEKIVHKHFDGIYTKPSEKFDGSGETYVGVSITEIEDFIKNNFQE